MNDQSKMIHNPVQSQMMNLNPVQQPPVQMLPQSQSAAAPPPVIQPQIINPVQMMNNNNRPQPYKPWQQQHLPPQGGPRMKSNFGPNRSNWKGKHVTTDNQKPRKDHQRRIPVDKSNLNNNNMKVSMNMMNMNMHNASLTNVVGVGGGGGGYIPPSIHELQSQNRMKARKFYSKKNFNNGNNNNRFAPYGFRSRAPRNTTSFIIRAKKSGGIASLVSPCPVTPAVLPTPVISPSREVLGDLAKEEWGVDGYGSMKGLIRLRPTGQNEIDDEEEDEGGNGSSESDVEEHVEVERRLDHDLSRFEMICPNYGYRGGAGGGDYANLLENRVDDQDTHITQLEEENLTLKERLFLMESEISDLRRRLQFLERQNLVGNANEEVVENESENENESYGGSDVRGGLDNNNQHEVMSEYVNKPEDVDVEIIKEENNDNNINEGGVPDVCMEDYIPDVADKKENLPENAENEIVTVNPVVIENEDLEKVRDESGTMMESTGNGLEDDEIVQKEIIGQNADTELGISEFQEHTVVTQSDEANDN
ncbi:hypothetical protein ACFE04_027378 [Oxalis oulophora]